MLLPRLQQDGGAHPLVDQTRLELRRPEDARRQTPLARLLDLLKLSRRTPGKIHGFPLLPAPKKDGGSSVQTERKDELCFIRAGALLLLPVILPSVKRILKGPRRLSAVH